jgi:dihydroxyacetone kinase-like predicted kinase
MLAQYRPVPGRAVIAAAPGPGLAELFAEAGAIPLPCFSGRPPTSAQLSRAIAAAGVEEIIVLVNDAEGLAAASAAAEQVHRGANGVRVAVVPSKAVVQGIAALAVHEPGRRFDADIVAMTAAAGATRHAALQIAADDAWTMAGVCHAGDVLGFIEGDVALIAPSLRDAALALVDRMVSAGGEMVTLVTGDGLDEAAGGPDGSRLDAAELIEAVRARVHAARPEMDVVAYQGGQSGWPLLIGVE